MFDRKCRAVQVSRSAELSRAADCCLFGFRTVKELDIVRQAAAHVPLLLLAVCSVAGCFAGGLLYLVMIVRLPGGVMVAAGCHASSRGGQDVNRVAGLKPAGCTAVCFVSGVYMRRFRCSNAFLRVVNFRLLDRVFRTHCFTLLRLCTCYAQQNCGCTSIRDID